MHVPESWPDPLGFITTDEPRWVEPQTGWKQTGAFKGNVRGSIPDPRDNRHPDLPNDAFALTGVIIKPPDREAKHHVAARNIPFERPPDSWAVDLKHERCNGSYTSDVYLFSTEIEDPPAHQHWKSAPHSRTEWRWVEYFESRSAAIGFVKEETGLQVPDQ